ncbi:MAG: amidohydrolase, partial [Zoogloeaceae bacterium]|nr:amidohydrolase [Zoogloeaceae bacterium]
MAAQKRFNLSRRRFLMLGGALAAGGIAGSCLSRPFLVNPCRDASRLPEALQNSPWLAQVWQGLDPEEVWDCHAHLAGIGDGDSGVQVGQSLTSLLHPVLYTQRLFYLNAGCVSERAGTVDENYVRRLADLAARMPAGFKVMLFAFDWLHNEAGQPVP